MVTEGTGGPVATSSMLLLILDITHTPREGKIADLRMLLWPISALRVTQISTKWLSTLLTPQGVEMYKPFTTLRL